MVTNWLFGLEYESYTEDMETVCVLCKSIFESRTSYGLCPVCVTSERAREYDRVESSKRATHKLGLSATLSLVEWLSALSDSEWKCAFCDEYLGHVIERVEPSEGLTYANVVPACRACSKWWREGYDRMAMRVRKYLNIVSSVD